VPSSCFFLVEEEAHETTNIRDLEFLLTNDVQQLKSRASSLSEKEIQLVKLILCSSLYPQLAIGDEHNAYRKSNEIVFNTPSKSFSSIDWRYANYLCNSQELFIHSSQQRRRLTSGLGTRTRKECQKR
jgi:hypothetical protein